MLNIVYHKTFKETGFKRCVHDDIYRDILDYIEWFDSPDLVDRKSLNTPVAKIIVAEPEISEVKEDIVETKIRKKRISRKTKEENLNLPIGVE